jgi:uncharacterized protein
MATARTRSGHIEWHELLAPELDRAAGFYGSLLGWDVELSKPEEGDYPMIHVSGTAHGGFQRTHPDSGIPPHWVAYVRVPDPDASAARAFELGGEIRVKPLAVRDVGRLAVLQDREGAEIAVIAPEQERPPPTGVFGWDELRTRDIAGARRFYEEVLGWTAEETMFHAGDEPVAGLRSNDDAMPSSTWISYLATTDIDQTVTRARELGGAVTVDVAEAKGAGRFALIRDPVGATAGLLQREA